MTTINDKINRANELIAQREAIDAELAELFNGGGAVSRRTVKCSVCGNEGHTVRTCSNKENDTTSTQTPAPAPSKPPFMSL